MKNPDKEPSDLNDPHTALEIKAVFEKAYGLMDEPVIEGNCGELCGYHCCRDRNPGGDKLGMYLLPLEFESMQSGKVTEYIIHRSSRYHMPPQINKLYYIFCHSDEGCLRDLRPIQCRTYPFEPHLENGEFSLVIEKAQIHVCPLMDNIPEWRLDFITGIYEGWVELLNIPIVKHAVEYDSAKRTASHNVLRRFAQGTWQME